MDSLPATPGLHSAGAHDAYERHADFLAAVYEPGSGRRTVAVRAKRGLMNSTNCLPKPVVRQLIITACLAFARQGRREPAGGAQVAGEYQVELLLPFRPMSFGDEHICAFGRKGQRGGPPMPLPPPVTKTTLPVKRRVPTMVRFS